MLAQGHFLPMGEQLHVKAVAPAFLAHGQDLGKLIDPDLHVHPASSVILGTTPVPSQVAHDLVQAFWQCIAHGHKCFMMVKVDPSITYGDIFVQFGQRIDQLIGQVHRIAHS